MVDASGQVPDLAPPQEAGVRFGSPNPLGSGTSRPGAAPRKCFAIAPTQHRLSQVARGPGGVMAVLDSGPGLDVSGPPIARRRDLAKLPVIRRSEPRRVRCADRIPVPTVRKRTSICFSHVGSAGRTVFPCRKVRTADPTRSGDRMINKTHIPPGPVRRSRIDWSDVKHRLDLGMVATNLLGPPRLRSGKRLLWLCPFHDDRNPSLQVDLARKTWRCWACAIGGDAAALVRRVNGCDFPAAVAFLAELSGVIIPSKGENRPSRDPVVKDSQRRQVRQRTTRDQASPRACPGRRRRPWSRRPRPASGKAAERRGWTYSRRRAERSNDPPRRSGLHPASAAADQGRRPLVPFFRNRHPLD